MNNRARTPRNPAPEATGASLERKRYKVSSQKNNSTQGLRKGLIKKLDAVFSQYIRLRAANHQGYVRCFVTGTVHHWKELDAGHFIPRAKIGTRFDERNVHPQSIESNRENSGDHDLYQARLVAEYGDSIISELTEDSRTKISTPDLQEMLEKYQDKLLTLKHERNII